MKSISIILGVAVATALLAGCGNNQPLTKAQQCDNIQRQITVYKQPNSGYTWNVAQLKIQKLQAQAQTIGC